MVKEKLNIVWLKRDLRIQDHAPLFHAESDENDYLIIYLFEPQFINYPDSSLRHLQFVYHSILDINSKLFRCGREVMIFHEEALEVFAYLSQQFEIQKVFSYQESGIKATWERDKAVANYFRNNKILWKEFQRDGILRGIRNRKNWDKNWYAHANSEILSYSYSHSEKRSLINPFPLEPSLLKELEAYPETFQKPGETYAWKYLLSFCRDRGKNYQKYISKPLESRKSCGRISPYLAWGNISIKQAYQFVRNHENYAHNKRAFSSFLVRLKWHCHFIQKFEVESDYELRCINRGYESLHFSNDPVLIHAWKNGKTGFPLVDACMRCLKETGWINFRMRAMLVSVFCHHFDCHWKEGVYHLARLFLDYEPGIHFTQFQMQAGTTGINTVRMYNPVKQSKDHDTNGVFIKKWVPELCNVPTAHIHEPWKMTPMEMQLMDFPTNYPDPPIDLLESGRRARAKIWGHRKSAEVRTERKRIIELHTRNSGSKTE